MTRQIKMSWNRFDAAVRNIAAKIKKSGIEVQNIYGIPRGGLCIAVRLSHLLKLPLITDESQIGVSTLIVDDVSDKGNALLKLVKKMSTFYDATLYYNKEESVYQPRFWIYEKPNNSWIIFPWEKK